jgi:ribosome-associated heat shock protein Hsp15
VRLTAVDEARVDRWLWAVRLSKSRTEATTACQAGHVRINGRRAKPASHVTAGDRIDARLHGVNRTIEVTRVIDARVGAPIAIGCYLDHTPPPEPTEPSAAHRDRGSGRPTKRERRETDRWQSRSR